MLRFVDCDMGVGGSGQGYAVPAAPAAALALLDRYNIDKALVYDRAAMEAGVFDRCEDIVAFCEPSGGRLLPTIPAAPPGAGEAPPPDALVAMMLARGIRGVRFWPDEHAFDFDPFTLGPLLTLLERHRLPVFVHLSEAHAWQHRPGWRAVRETALAFPKLPIVVLWGGMLDGRRLLPLLDGCPNVLADFTCVTYQFLEYVVEELGSSQLVYASHFPRHDPGMYLPWIIYSGVDPEAREDLAWRNAARLAEGVR